MGRLWVSQELILPSPTPRFYQLITVFFQILSLLSGFRDRVDVFARPPFTGSVVYLKKLMFLVLPRGENTGMFSSIGDNPVCRQQESNPSVQGTCPGVQQTKSCGLKQTSSTPNLSFLLRKMEQWLLLHKLLSLAYRRTMAETGSGDIRLEFLGI